MQKPILYPPKGAEAWIAQLKDFSLPILPSMSQSVLKRLAQPNVGFFEIAEGAAQSPIISFNLIQKVNRRSLKVASVDHAISLLGVEQTQRLIQQIPILKLQPARKAHQYYFRAVSCSCFAGILARDWSKLLHTHQSNELFWSSLMFGSPWWYLSYFAGLETQLIHYLSSQHPHKPIAHFEQLILGCSMMQLAQQLGQAWHFPEFTQHAYELAQAATAQQWTRLLRADVAMQRDGFTAFHSPAMAVYLANWLSQSMALGWYHRRTQRVMRFVALYLNMDIQQCYRQIQTSALQFARSYRFPLVDTPISRLLFTSPISQQVEKPLFMHYQQHQKQQQSQERAVAKSTDAPLEKKSVSAKVMAPAAKRSQATARTKPVESKQSVQKAASTIEMNQGRQPNKQKLQKVIALLQQPEQIDSLADGIALWCQGMVEGAAFDRCVIARFDHQRKILAPVFLQTIDSFAEQSVHFKYQFSPLLKKMLQQATTLQVETPQIAKMADALPCHLVDWLKPAESIMATIFVQQQASVWIYVDKANSDVALNARDCQLFKHLNKVAAKYLATLSD